MRTLRTRIFALLLISVIFIVDINIPPGVALSILYIIPMAIIFNESRRTIISFALLCCVLAIIDDLIYLDTKVEYNVFIDSMLAIIAILLSSFASIKYRSLKEKSQSRKDANIKYTLEMLFMASHKLRQPICSIQGLNILLESEKDTASREDLRNITAYLKDSITNLDVRSQELIDYLSKIRKENEMDDF